MKKYHGKDLSTNDFTDGYKKKIDSMQTLYRFKGTVNTENELSFIEDRNVGDTYKCIENSNTYIWNGTEWINAGQDVDYSEILEQIDTYQEEVNTQINEVNEQLTNIKQEGIIVSPTEPTENRRKVWMQNVDGDKKIHVLNDNDVYEEFMKKEENVDSSKILHHGETLNNLLNKGTFKEYNGNLSGNTTYDINLSLGQFSIVIVTLIQGFNAEIVGAFTANYTGYFFTQFLKQTIASTFLDKIERRDYFLRLTVKNTSNIQYKIKVLTL